MPDLSSPPRMVSGPLLMIPSSMKGFMPLPGTTVSMWAESTKGSPGRVPGKRKNTLNPSEPKVSPALSVMGSRPRAFTSRTRVSPMTFSWPLSELIWT